MYNSLEPQIISQVTGKPANGKIGQSFFATSEFIYILLFVAIVAAAFYRYALAGIWMMAASEKYMRMSKDEFRRVTLGLLGVFSMFIVIYTFNKDLLLGDVGLAYLKVTGQAAPAITSGRGGDYAGAGATGQGAACSATQNTISALQSGNVCAGAKCTALKGCNYAPYLPFLRTEAQNKGVPLKMLIVIMCKESAAIPTREHLNNNGSRDCGLMQINQLGSCSPALMDPATNIARGAEELKSKLGSQTFPGVPAEASVFAAYNCCSNGNANAVSVDCDQSAGFTGSIPKWACPIKPGPTETNMCFVKNYACEATACLSDPSLSSF